MRSFSADPKNPTVKTFPLEVCGLMQDAGSKLRDPHTAIRNPVAAFA